MVDKITNERISMIEIQTARHGAKIEEHERRIGGHDTEFSEGRRRLWIILTGVIIAALSGLAGLLVQLLSHSAK